MTKDKLSELVNNSNSYLAHYTSLDIAIEYIFKDKEIRLSSLSLTNDPKEYKKKNISAFSYGHDSAYDKEKKVEDYFQNELLDKCKVFCVSCDNENNPYNLSTKKCYSKPRMWAQYGNNHKGLCLIFKKDILIKKFKELVSNNNSYLFHDEVVYDDFLNKNDKSPISIEQLTFNDNQLQSYFVKQLSQYQWKWFFRKDLDWSSENEYRFVIYSNEKDYIHLSYSDALKYVVLGENCSMVYTQSLKHLLSSNIPLLQLNWDESVQDYYLKNL